MHKFLILGAAFFVSLAVASEKIPVGKIVEHEKMAHGHRICIIGDSGQGILDQYRVGEAMAKAKCDSIRHTGDIIYPDGLESANDPQFFTKFYYPYKEIIEKQKIPFFMSLGNHDYKENPGAWYDLSLRYDWIHMPSFYYADVFGDVCFVMLDSMDAENPAQLKWVQDFKKKYHKLCKVSMAFAHHPYRSAGKHSHAQGDYKKFMEASVVGSFDAYFAGHDHILDDEGVHQGTAIFVSGAGAKVRSLRRDPGIWAASKLGFMVVELLRSENEVSLVYEFYATSRESDDVRILHKGVIDPQGIRIGPN